ncbi:MAG: hypothetical protein A2075_12450 [Geobacteraceae bacterium GWC2_58_44]|nr:MAG: hypothetical protein A2075_12450 [Geobacteraceae bacterium GWC2_58_44]HBG06902.1 hypothetical protein [Geobacter sp.]
MKVAIYSIETGKIKMFVSGPASQVACDVQAGEEFFLNCPEGATHIIDGKPETRERVKPFPTLEEILREINRALERHSEKVAQSRRYDSPLTCALRAGYPGPFQAEGVAFGTWMDNCNAYVYAEMAKVSSGERAVPRPEEVISELPPMVWPDV